MYTWPDGNKYIGDWHDNAIHGYGIYVWSDGRVYCGNWQNNMMDGEGTYKWLDGRMYHGQYKNDKKNGYGVYVWADGRAYIGNWTEGKQDDERVYILPNGTVRKGRWEGNTRKEWLEMADEEKNEYKQNLQEALRRAKDVEVQRRAATNEVEEIIRGQDLQAQRHEEEQLPESEQVLEVID
jgi:hypothetical protein